MKIQSSSSGLLLTIISIVFAGAILVGLRALFTNDRLLTNQETILPSPQDECPPFTFFSLTEESADIIFDDPRLGTLLIRSIRGGSGSVTRIFQDSLDAKVTIKVSFNPALIACANNVGLEGVAEGITTTYMTTTLETARKVVEMREHPEHSKESISALLSLLDLPISWEDE